LRLSLQNEPVAVTYMSNYGAYLFVYRVVVEPIPRLLRPFIGLLYQPWMMDGDDCETISGMNG
jgi:hypothetical protein